ncbi:3-deoxy-D-manno-octulosonic acid transferase [Lichenihabitans psoromatis]|uniref:3-deoxy-D-manno-octulosonic acid transferase n=1 Tax=Lichenihabitans psoromatis TaxID=2528642 RepID=UPI0010383CB0|nr:3-deoxy-D-manno-octulosonic acid transferase [Lichenihabitans psoromatis]
MKDRHSLLLLLYRGGSRLLGPAAGSFLRRRERRGKETLSRLGERMGLAGEARPEGPIAWLHGASVGEALALLPLIERLTTRGFAVLVTTGTVSSAAILGQRLPPGAIHQFLPLDIPRFVSRFLDHWRPDLAMLAESELWPNLIVELSKRDVPLLLVNARLSARSFGRWRRFPRFIRAVLDRTTLCVAQTKEDADRFKALGAPTVTVGGNLKFDVPPPPADRDRVSDLAGLIGSRPVWLAASTHVDEEAIMLDVHRRLLRRFPDVLTIVVPRQTERGGAIAEAAANLGLRAALRSRSQTLDHQTHVYVADTMGELGLFYRLTGVVFVGKSLAGGGGQNPIEPAKLGSAILHGPLVANFAEVYRTLDAAEGAATMADGKALADTLTALLSDGVKLRRMARAAADAVERHCGATDRTMRAIEPFAKRVFARQGL